MLWLPIINTVSHFSISVNNDDLSSLSGSNSDDDDDEGFEEATSMYLETPPEVTRVVIRPPFLIFNWDDQFYKIYYSLLCHRKNDTVTDEIITERFRNIASFGKKKEPKFCARIAVFLYTAQHFAGAVFEGVDGEMVLHKTYHRYTVRAKQGTIQGVRDGKGNAPKSLGASLRRYNQIALFNDVEKLLLEWGEQLRRCHTIFYRAAQYNRNVFDKLKSDYLRGYENKLVSVPLTTYRPTLKECKRVYQILTAFKPSDKAEFEEFRKSTVIPENLTQEEIHHSLPSVNPRSIPNSHLKRKDVSSGDDIVIEKKLWYDDENQVMHHVIHAIKDNNFEKFSALLSGQTDFSPSDIIYHIKLVDGDTLLHLAAVSPDVQFLTVLLEKGCNPELCNKYLKTPYDVTISKEHRNILRRFMADNPDQWDYKKAKIPSPLTREMEAKQAQKKQAKKKAERESKKIRSQERKITEDRRKKQEDEDLIKVVRDLRTKSLTSREKCLLAAESRLAAEQGLRGSTSGSCTVCHTGLDGLVPFEKNNLKFCSINCVKENS